MSVLQNAVLVIQVPTFLQSTNNNNPKISTLKMIEVSDENVCSKSKIPNLRVLDHCFGFEIRIRLGC
jgi:hypothetical protein